MLNRKPRPGGLPATASPGNGHPQVTRTKSDANKWMERLRWRKTFPRLLPQDWSRPLIGTRTGGGLIGVSGVPGLIDGGGITVPTFRMYNPDGTWFKEGHGVDPDIPVAEDLTLAAQGKDNQLERAITEITERTKKSNLPPPIARRPNPAEPSLSHHGVANKGSAEGGTPFSHLRIADGVAGRDPSSSATTT